MRWCCGVAWHERRTRTLATALVTARIDILHELGLTPVWRLRTSYRSVAASDARHAVSEPIHSVSEAPAVGEGTQAAGAMAADVAGDFAADVVATMSVDAVGADITHRITRIASLGWAHFSADVSACTACGLARTRNMAVPGVGDVRADWLFVGEAPGAEEDARGEPFVGQAGRLLDSMLAALGMNRAKAVYIANMLKCRPPGNRAPTPLEVDACKPYLDRQIALIQPKLIVALGKSAATSLLRAEASIASLRGRVHRYQGIPMIVTYHPAYLLRTLPDKAKAWEDLCLARATLRGILAAKPL
jgi:uracil-DNA glycosylase